MNNNDDAALQKALTILQQKLLALDEDHSRKRTRLVSAIEALTDEAGGSSVSPVIGELAGSRPYLGMSLPDAAIAHLISVKGSFQSRKALAKAVLAGGLQSKAQDLEGNLGWALERRRRPDSKQYEPRLNKNKRGHWRILVLPHGQ
jgi:hypothetical protein